jgi:E-phenylitaconyl-CoA hydratase
MPAAWEIGRKIARNAPLAVRAVKQLVTRGADLPLSQALNLDKYMYGLLKDTEDRIEGRKAFAEKREPVWKGR